jgi:hypothetical protein
LGGLVNFQLLFSNCNILIFARRVCPFIFFASITVLYFGDIRDLIFTERDLLVFFIPPRQFWVEEVKNFIFPLWNPHYFNGQPLFATLQPGVLYPFSILYFFLPFHWAFNLNIEIHFALSGWFTYLLLRAMKASQGASVVSGLSFMLSGYLISVFNVLSTLQSVTWVPLFFLVYFAAITKNHTGFALLTGLVGTIMFLGGGVEVCYMTFGVAFFLTLFPELVLIKEEHANLKHRIRLFFYFCLIFFGLSAIQLIPFLELSQLSLRSSGLSYKQAGLWSMHPGDLIEFFVPDQYGVASLDVEKYWSYQHWLKTTYMGGIPFLLSLFFIKKLNRQVLGYSFLFLLSIGLALGNNTLFHSFLFDYLPFFNKLRYPVKFIFLAIIILCIVSGLGYDCLKRTFSEKTKNQASWAICILFIGFSCMIIFGVLNFYNQEFVIYFNEIGWVPPKYNDLEVNLFNLKRFLAFTGLFCLLIFLFSKPKFNKTLLKVSMMGLLALDLFFANYKFFNVEEIDKFNRIGENPKFILSDKSIFRTHVSHDTKFKNFGKIKKKEIDSDLRKEKFTAGFLGNQPIYFLRGIAVTQQKRSEHLNTLIRTLPETESSRLLDMMNVKYLVSIPSIQSERYKLVHANIPLPQQKEELDKFEKSNAIKVYENTKVLPRAFLVPNCKIIKTGLEYKKEFEGKLFDPKSMVLLEKEVEGFDCSQKRTIDNKDLVKIDSYKSNSVDLTIHSNSNQFLFMSDSFYPGWKALIDGKETEILRGNYLFRAIPVSPGKHQIRFKYDPLSFKLGLMVTSFSVLFLGIYFFKSRKPII